jgi:hypothetical protein
MKKPPGIHIILEKDKGGNYTEDAILYQDIVHYAITLRKAHPDNNYNNSFRERELANWLLNNNKEFVNSYKSLSTRTTTWQNRIENRLPRIRNKLDDLIELDLVKKCGTTKALKNSDIISLYKFTLDGYLISYVMEGLFHPRMRENADNEIYNLYMWHFEHFPTYRSPFSSGVYKKLKEAGAFGCLVDMYRDVILKGTTITSMQELMSATAIPQPILDMAKENPSRLSNMLRKVIGEMDREKQHSYFYGIKEEIESKMSQKVDNAYEYTELRFKFRARIDLVALAGLCENCKSIIPKVYNLLSYFTEVKCIPGMTLLTKCPKCEKERSVIFPRL